MTEVKIEIQKSYRYKATFEVSFTNKLVVVKIDIPVKPVGKLAPLSIIRLSYLLKQNLKEKPMYKYILVCSHRQIATES